MSEKEIIIRPWGHFFVIEETPYYKIKEIFVLPNGKLSLQSHKFRHELWNHITGEGIITINDEKYTFNSEFPQFCIMKGEKHRIENVGITPLIFIEIQIGTSFDENDILRFEDSYGRVK